MNDFTVTSPGRPDTTITAEGLLNAVEQYAESREAMEVGDVHLFTIVGASHAIDATITAEGSPRQDRVDMVFRELADAGVQDQPGLGVEFVNAVCGS